MIVEIYFIFVLALVFFLLVFIIPLLSEIFLQKNDYLEKVSAYECGFQPFEDTLMPFEVRYYLVAIIFLIFDLELMFFLPWLFSLKSLSISGIFSMLVFLFVLTMGFFYEWISGGLEWN